MLLQHLQNYTPFYHLCSRQILELRHFDGFSNLGCAEALGLSPKAASLRYVRALQRLQRLLLELTEFRP